MQPSYTFLAISTTLSPALWQFSCRRLIARLPVITIVYGFHGERWFPLSGVLPQRCGAMLSIPHRRGSKANLNWPAQARTTGGSVR